MFAVFLRTLDDRQPKWQQDNSLIGSSPGLGAVPRASLIMYNSSDMSIAKLWIEQLDEFLAPYIEKSENVQNCDKIRRACLDHEQDARVRTSSAAEVRRLVEATRGNADVQAFRVFWEHLSL
jgi:hypothetical protein